MLDRADTTLSMDLPTQLPTPAMEERIGTLTLLTGTHAGTTHILSTGLVTLGRDPTADIVLDDDHASRVHARVQFARNHYYLEDLRSTNGTWVDSARLQGECALHPGARFQLGRTIVRFDLQDRIEQEATRRVYETSVRDGLTGLYNRRHFDERLASEFAFAHRHRTPLSIVMVDVDHFKRINDRHGHPAGDLVLRTIARALLAAMRAEDLVARYGGEELVILARGIDSEGTRRVAERVRRLVDDLRIETPAGILHCQVSVGFAHNQMGQPPATADVLLAGADAALYRAKENGRNRVEGPLPDGQYRMTARERNHPRRERVWDKETRPIRD